VAKRSPVTLFNQPPTEGRACEGEPTVKDHDFDEMVRCQACGTSVRHDLVDNKFFGFQNCMHRRQS
jgi:hypothetical protein